MGKRQLTHDEAVREVYRLTPQIRDYDEFMYMGVRWLAYTMFDYPQSLRGFPIRARLRLLRRALAPTIGYGLTCSLLFWTACAIPLLLPVGVIAATQLFWRVAQSDPDLRR